MAARRLPRPTPPAPCIGAIGCGVAGASPLPQIDYEFLCRQRKASGGSLHDGCARQHPLNGKERRAALRALAQPRFYTATSYVVLRAGILHSDGDRAYFGRSRLFDARVDPAAACEATWSPPVCAALRALADAEARRSGLTAHERLELWAEAGVLGRAGRLLGRVIDASAATSPAWTTTPDNSVGAAMLALLHACSATARDLLGRSTA